MRLLVYVLHVIILSVGFGCSSSKTENKKAATHILRMNIVDEPQVLDPRKARNLQCVTLMTMLFEGLTRVNPDGRAELALAEKVEVSEDLKMYTVQLKKSLWSNADPVKASDFAYAWKKMLSPSFPSDTAFHLYVIKNAKAAKQGTVDLDDVGVHVIDDYTLKIELENPTPYFLDLLASAPFFPVHQKSDESNPLWAQNAEGYLSNGPFALKKWDHQNALTLEKNPHYWDAAQVKIDGLQLLMVKEDTELMLFEKNEIDWAGSPISLLPVDALETLKLNYSIKTKELLGTYFIRTNTQKVALSHPSLRRALSLAIDRKGIVDHVTKGNQIPATGLVPLCFGLQSTPYFSSPDLIEAKRLFEEGLKALKFETFPEISLLYRSNERNHLIAQVLQQQWFEAFNVRIKLEGVESKVYFDRVSKGDYEMTSGSWIADFPDPINFLEVFKLKNGGSNNTFWENSTYAALLDQSSQVADPQLRNQLLRQSEEILMNEMPIIPIFYFNMLYLTQPHVNGVALSSMGVIDFKWASIEEDKK